MQHLAKLFLKKGGGRQEGSACTVAVLIRRLEVLIRRFTAYTCQGAVICTFSEMRYVDNFNRGNTNAS